MCKLVVKEAETKAKRAEVKRKEFKPREDTFTLEGILDIGKPLAYCSSEDEEGNENSSFEELGINKICGKALSYAYQSTSFDTQYYFYSLFRRPLSDKEEIEKRQKVFVEVYSNEVIYNKLKLLIDVMISYTKSRHKFVEIPQNFNDKLVQGLENASQLVKLVEAICELSDSTSPRLKRIYEFGKQIADDKGFKEVKRFVKKVYEPTNLGVVIYEIRQSLCKQNLGQIDNPHEYKEEKIEPRRSINKRRAFKKEVRTLYEATKMLFKSKLFEDFIDKEDKETDLLSLLRKKKQLYSRHLFAFNDDLNLFQKNENPLFFELLEYWLIVVNEAIESRMPNVKIGELSEELRFYLAVADMQKKWKELGGYLTTPKILSKEEKRHHVVGSYSPILLVDNRKLDDKSEYVKPVPNGFISGPNTNIFVITGPNNAGKSTYLTQIGQICWLAYMGISLPAQEAEISLVDFLFTSIDRKSNSDKGEGLHMAELAKIARYIHRKCIPITIFKDNDKKKGNRKDRTKKDENHRHEDNSGNKGGSRNMDGSKNEDGSNNSFNTSSFITPYSLVLFDEFGAGTDHAEAVYRTKVLLNYLSNLGTTTYLTTHKQEIAEVVEAGELQGSLNLAMKIKKKCASVVSTYKVLRNAREKSYGHQIAEELGLTEHQLANAIEEGIKRGLYPIEATRMRKSKP